MRRRLDWKTSDWWSERWTKEAPPVKRMVEASGTTKTEKPRERRRSETSASAVVFPASGGQCVGKGVDGGWMRMDGVDGGRRRGRGSECAVPAQGPPVIATR